MFDLLRTSGDFFNQLFDEFTTKPSRFSHVMKTDIKELEDRYYLEMELAGFKKEDVTAQIENGYLKVTAKRSQEEKKEDEKLLLSERSYGQFQRSFYVGDIDPDKLEAQFKDGILRLEIPKQNKKEHIKYLDIK